MNNQWHPDWRCLPAASCATLTVSMFISGIQDHVFAMSGTLPVRREEVVQEPQQSIMKPHSNGVRKEQAKHHVVRLKLRKLSKTRPKRWDSCSSVSSATLSLRLSTSAARLIQKLVVWLRNGRSRAGFQIAP